LEALKEDRMQAIEFVLEKWEQVDRVAHDYLVPIENEAQYQAALELLAVLWDKVGEDSHSPFGTLLGILSERINTYEVQKHPIPDALPHQVLAFLMDQQNLTQKALEKATVIHQSNLSKILQGERKLTTDQIKTLAAHFGVNPNVFL
jgi:HTH-type transcriptional regulator / antitoxin HigA